MRFDNESYKNEPRNEIFRKVNEKGEKKKKNSKGLAKKALPFWEWKLELRERHEVSKRKRKVYLIEKNEKSNEQWGEGGGGVEEKSGMQPVNNSLASFRHQRGRNSTDPRPANACTNYHG